MSEPTVAADIPMPSPTTATHSDIRSAEHDFKRSRDHAQKYKYVSKPGNTPVKYGGVFDIIHRPDPETGERPISFHGFGVETHPYNNHNKSRISKPGYYGSRGRSCARVESAYFAKLACLEHSPAHLVDVPGLDFVTASAPTSGDEGVLYSFDRADSPASSLEFGGLVEKAEAHFRARETERIVRGEYEVLDKEGETVREGRRGRRGSPKVEVVEGEVDGEWEAI